MVPSASSKYYVYGDGRWRELDTVTGRVSGWRGARLCVARRGRLATQHGSQRRRVLAALRALATRTGPGAADTAAELTARDGPRLQSKQSTHNTPRSTRCRCRCCCHNNNNNNNRCGGKSPPTVSKARTQQPLTSDACIQAASPEPARSPRLAFPTYAGRQLTTVATVHNTPMETRKASTPIGSSKKRNNSSSTSWKHVHGSSSGSTESPVNYTNTTLRKTNTSPKKVHAFSRQKVNLSLKRKHTNSESSGTSKDEISISQSILKKDFNAKYLRARIAEAPPRAPPRLRTRLTQRNVIDVSSDDENKDPTVNLTSTGRETEDTETEEVITNHRQKIQDKMDIYRELVISEDDVDVLRGFMIKNNPKFNLYKYDNDDAYKARFFYSINPLVSIEPCPRILDMLEGQDGLSLQQFASQLGLRSVSDGASSSGRAPPRKRRRPTTKTPDSEDKENLETTVGQSNQHNNTKEKEKRHTEDRMKLKDMTDVTVSLEKMKDDDGQRRRNRGRRPERNIHGQNMHRDNLKRSTDNTHLKDERRKRQKQQETEAEGMKLVHEGNHSDKQKVITEKRVNGAPTVVQEGGDFRSKEYSSLEDHAIVKWISSGDRAKLVNGNRVWRLLEQSFEEIGGRARSWHSLRNRYLRHLLPRLGLLELPVTQQARLRAAAAQGEIKGKKYPQKRNSIYGEPVRGASSRELRRSPRQPASAPAPAAAPASARAPAAAPATARAPAAARAVTPRYSDVTRQFAARHPVSSSSEFEAESPVRTRSRKSNPQTAGPGSLTRTPNSQTAGPGPLTRTSNPQILGPGPLTRTSNPQTAGPGPLTRTFNPQTAGPNPGSRTRKLYNPKEL